MAHPPVHYADYLSLETLLNAQHPVSFQPGNQAAHDEMLFIIIHQSYELWFKQIDFEVQSILNIMQQPVLNDNSADLQTIVHRLNRVNTILRLLVQQIDIMETMTAMDFLDFRDLLRPASGFQSWQFKKLEAMLGLKYEQRFGQHYYTSQLRPAEVDLIHQTEAAPSLIELLNQWLERMPFIQDEKYWEGYQPVTDVQEAPVFWNDYTAIYRNSLAPAEQDNSKLFDEVFGEGAAVSSRQLSARACRSALFILLYRGYPMLELPFRLLEGLLETDSLLGNWRYRHFNMVQKMIGSRIGTGGSTGAHYLKAAMDQHYIYKELSRLTSFLINRRQLPVLPAKLVEQLGYQF